MQGTKMNYVQKTKNTMNAKTESSSRFKSQIIKVILGVVNDQKASQMENVLFCRYVYIWCVLYLYKTFDDFHRWFINNPSL